MSHESIRLRALLFLAAFCAFDQLDAQSPIETLRSSVGAPLRFRAPSSGLHFAAEGTLDSVGAESLYLRSLREPPELRRISRLAVPLDSITLLDVRVTTGNRWSRARKGALWGVGAWALFATGYVVHESRTCEGPDCFGEGMAIIGIAGGFIYSAAFGAAIGFALPVSRWRPVIRQP